MVESIPPKEFESLNLICKINGYYIEENNRSLHIKLPSGTTFWVPKRYTDSNFSRKLNIRQDFIIETWILKKIGFKI